MSSNEQSYAIGLDIGGTKVLSAIIDRNGTTIHKMECPTLVESGSHSVIGRIVKLIESLLSRTTVGIHSIRGIGIATAGVIDSDTNEVVFANNLGWEHVPIGDILSDYFRLPIRMSNDANAATIAEWMWGAGRGTQDFIYITVSTGIGAGIVSGGRLLKGASNSAGEFGHITIDRNGPACACGNRGCLETYASGTALAKLAADAIQNGAQSKFLTNTTPAEEYSITARDIGEAAEKGDPLSIHLLEQIGSYLGIGLTNLIHLFNPDVVAFGGGVMNCHAILLPAIEKTVKERGIKAMVDRVRIVKSLHGSDTGVKGAAALFFSKQETRDEIQI